MLKRTIVILLGILLFPCTVPLNIAQVSVEVSLTQSVVEVDAYTKIFLFPANYYQLNLSETGCN